MFCTRCQNNIANCECDDIEERLASLAEHPNFATDRCKHCRRNRPDCTCDEYVPVGGS